MLFFLFLFEGGSNFGGRCVQKVFFSSCFTYLYIYYLFIVSYYFCLLFYSLLYLYIFKALSDANMQFIVSQWILLYHICPFISLSHSLPPKEYIQARLDNKSVPEMYLRNLHDLYCQTVKLCTELQRFNLGNDSQFLSKLTKSIFQRHLSS